MFRAIKSWGIVSQNADSWTLGDKNLGRVVSAVQRAQDSSLKLLEGRGGDPREIAADMATLSATAFRYRRANPGGVSLGEAQLASVEAYMLAPTERYIQALQKVAKGDLSGLSEFPDVAGLDRVHASRMMQWIGNEHAKLVQDAVGNLLSNPSDPERMRTVRRIVNAATGTDQWASGTRATPWNLGSPPGPGATGQKPGWQAALSGVDRILN
jgi:hypothetical protein